jgi:NAD(P)-dependent dehydrogenase (short-subunit alcohol dehydrogenase family)
MGIAPDRKALITGGASGFGLQVARRLHECGSQVALLDIAADRLDAAAATVGDERVMTIAADVSVPPLVHDAVERTIETWGGLDTLVHAAGVIHIKDLEDVSEADWDRTLDVNLKGAFFAAQAAAPALRSSGRGRIVSIGSDAAKRGWAGTQAYCASKFALVGLTESLAAELAPAGVTVNCVCPVYCPTTGMGKEVAAWKVEKTGEPVDVVIAKAARTNPLGRHATVDDIAMAVLHFIDDDSSFLTGIDLDVDGGAHLGGALPGT